MSGATGTIDSAVPGSATADSSKTPFQWPMVALGVALLLALAAGFALATWRGGTHMHTGRADMAGDGGGSIITPDWTYGFPAGVSWTDELGVWHTGGETPTCLSTEKSVMVRFASVDVTVEGTAWRPVVWIDCRGATDYVP